jgi:hypothetical protein
MDEIYNEKDEKDELTKLLQELNNSCNNLLNSSFTNIYIYINEII